jgi:transposase
VTWGRNHQNLDDIRSVGVDELFWKVRQKYLTLVYQIDNHGGRLLWIGPERTAENFSGFFEWLGEKRCQKLAFVVNDRWKVFLSTVAKRANTAIHLLNRFHVTRLFNEALNAVRRDEVRKLQAKCDTATLKHTRWVLFKRMENLFEGQFRRLRELMKANADTLCVYWLKEQF